MGIEITSTSDSKEAVAAAMADLAPVEKPVETPKDESKEGVQDDEVSKEPVDPDNEPSKDEDAESENDSDGEEEAEEVAAKDTTEKPKKKGGFQKKIDKLKAEVELWRSEALRAKTPVQQEQEQQQVAPTPDLSTKPKADDFKTVEEYEDAKDDWKYQQRRAKERLEENQSRVVNEQNLKLQKHGQRVKEFEKTFSDFKDHWNEALEEVGPQNLSLTVHELILDSDVGPALMKELADDPEELRRICQLTPLKAAKEFGKIEDRILAKKAAAPSKEKTKTSKVPAPVKTVRAKGSTPLGYREDMSQKEYEAWRKQSSGKGA